jgi:hypothetical protein
LFQKGSCQQGSRKETESNILQRIFKYRKMKKKKKMLQKKKKLQMRLSKKAPKRLADKTSDLADKNSWKKQPA